MAELPFAHSAERKVVTDRLLLRGGRTGRPRGPKQVSPHLGQLGADQFVLAALTWPVVTGCAVLYLAVRNLEDYRGRNVGVRSSGWKQALQAFTIYFEGRIPTP